LFSGVSRAKFIAVRAAPVWNISRRKAIRVRNTPPAWRFHALPGSSHQHRGFSPVIPGESKEVSRFNGFDAAGQTVETVRRSFLSFCTGLKPRC
jgi:hypothetical protein